MVKQRRYESIDMIRGFALLNMLAYHALYDLVVIFHIKIPWFRSQGAYYWQQAIGMTFIIIAGISCHYSKNLLTHGVKVLGGGVIISLVTLMAMPSQFVSFGILHFMGTAMIILSLIKKNMDKLSPLVGMITAFLMFIFTKKIPARYLGVGDMKLIPLPKWLYESDYLYAFGFPNDRFASSDYFPLLPWFFLLLGGYFLWGFIKHKTLVEKYGHIQLKGINLIGTKTLLIYMIHQPLIYSLFFFFHHFKSLAG